MTPRRPVHAALSLAVGGLAVAALVGCGNGMQVAGPGDPQESVVSGQATPSADTSVRPRNTPSASQSTDHSGNDAPKTDSTDGPESGGNATGENGSGGDATGENGSTGTDNSKKDKAGRDHGGSKRSGKHRSDDGGSAGSTGPGSESGKSGGSDGSSKDTSEPGSDSTSEPADNPDAAAATCALDDLAVGARIPEGSGAAGSSYVLITFTNTSGGPCTMYGYAGVSFVGNQNGTQLGKPAARERSAQPKRIKLSDGEVTTELLQIARAGNWDAAECAPTTSDGFRVYPPSSYTSAYVKFATDACQSKSVRQMTVYPVGTKS